MGTARRTAAVPVVDLRSARAAEELAAALSTIGFVQLLGHDASPAAAAALRSSCDQFFAADVDDKMRFVHPAPEANRGYRSRGAEALSYSLGQPSPPDLFESFNSGDDAWITESPLLQPTPWPTDIAPTLRAAAHAWMAQMQQLAARLDRLIESVLGPSAQLQPTAGHGPDMLACINYAPGPDGTEPTVDGQQRMGAHSDYTTFTILDADPVPGLQIIEDGEWADVIPEEDALLLNVGDVLAMMTNDRWPSTLHRVVPMDAGSAPHRRSVAYFHYPSLSTVIEPLPQFVSAAAPARYQPVTVQGHLMGKLTAPKIHQRATSASTSAGRLDPD